MLEALAKSELNISDFDLNTSNDGESLRIIHLSTNSFFDVREVYRGYGITWRVVGYSEKEYTGNRWPAVMGRMQSWAGDIVESLAIPDLWDELRHQREFFSETGYETSFNTPFTAGERSEIATQIRQIKDYLRAASSL